MGAFQFENFDPITLIIFVTLGILSFVAVAVGFYKFIQFMRLGVGKRREAEMILDTWLSGRADEAIRGASGRKSVLTRILQSVVSGLQARPGDPT